MKKTLLIISIILIALVGRSYLNNDNYSSNYSDEKNNISITVTNNDKPIDSVQVFILDGEKVLGFDWTNKQGLANVLINDISGKTVDIKATKEGFETFYLKGGLLSTSTSFQVNMNLVNENSNPTNFLEFKLEKETIKQQ